MTPDSAETIVRERYPNTELRFYEAVYEMGRQAPVQPESWSVYPSHDLGVQPLGTGSTALTAWVAASTRVLEGLRKPAGLRIKREHLADAGRIGAEAVLVAEIEAVLDRGEEVTVEEPDGSVSLLTRAANGSYATNPK